MRTLSMIAFAVGVVFCLLSLVDPFSEKMMLTGMMDILIAIYIKPTEVQAS